MNVTTIDRIATQHDGILHRLPVWTKLLLLCVSIAFVVSTWSIVVLIAIGAFWMALGIVGRLPIRLMLGLASYPLIFTVLFAITTEFGLSVAMALLLKGFVSALSLSCIILSTPYPLLFATLGKVLPRIINDLLFMTYRMLFIIAEELGSMMLGLRLRGQLSYKQPLKLVSSLSTALGTLVLFSFDVASRQYDILTIRGYSGRIHYTTTSPKQENSDE